MFQTIKIGAPTVPGNNATVTLFDSTSLFPGGLQQHRVTRVIFSFPGIDQASAADGLKGYKLSGTTWKLATFDLLPATVPADTGADSESYSILVMGEDHVKVTYTAGAAAPTVWTPSITAVVGNPVSGAV